MQRLIELAHQACISCSHILGDPHFLDKSPLALNLSVFLVGLELWKANKQALITAAMAAFALLRLLTNIVAGARGAVAPNFQQFIGRDKWLLITLWVTAAVVDISVTACMTYTLSKRRQNAIQRTTELLDKLILWTIVLLQLLQQLRLNQRGVLREQRKDGVISMSIPNSNSAPRMTIPGLSGTDTVNPDSDFYLSRSGSMQFSSNRTQPVIAIEMNTVTEMDHDADEAKSDGKAYVSV
ncbi:hypothetical protein D9758_015049 [Tetrapyrgos nigripes]|uniref:Uncharacterized protein n=1 Tax=Tetrapyrgos nigripes TaxID=182062 RepID=A0A8H5CUV9_9AGAR|nr:hypothetical protein D9758_015049 [Tetrapyrgos nigripes]